MEPVEINAGTYYLRQFRADDRMDDRPDLVEVFADAAMRRFVPQHMVTTLDEAGAYIADRAAGWTRGDRCTWAVAEPTTGGLLGEVGLKFVAPGAASADIAVWVAPEARGRGIATMAVDTVVRFGFGAIALAHVDYVCDHDNEASIALAKRCGFAHIADTTSLAGVPSLQWRRTAG